MLYRRDYPNQVACIRSTLLESAGVPHAFSTRIGGVSQGPFASLNLGNPGGSAIRDSEQNIHTNHLRLFDALDLHDRQACRVHQVHGCEVVILRKGDAPPAQTNADALLTDAPDLTLAIRTADCVPLLLCSRDGQTVAAVHAGWRGVIADVLTHTLTQMRCLGVHPHDILLAIGPCIGRDSFEVGEEVAAEFDRAFPSSPSSPSPVLRHPDRKPHVDLTLALRCQAAIFGLAPAQIDTGDYCTVRDRDLFFSHRRDQGLTGRMAAVIATRPGIAP